MFLRTLTFALLIICLTSEVADARSRRRRTKTFVAKKPPAASPAKICFTQAQFNRVSRFPLKTGCTVADGADRYCVQPTCLGDIAVGDFDGDGKVDQAITLRMSDKNKPAIEDEYWGVFASLSAYNVYLRAPLTFRSNIQAKGFMQARQAPEGSKEFTGWLITAAEGEKAETFGFDTKERRFKIKEAHATVDEQEGHPGIGLSALLGGNMNFTTGPTFPYTAAAGTTANIDTSWTSALGYSVGARIDGYITRFVSFEAGLLYGSQTIKHNVKGTVTSGSNTISISDSGNYSFSVIQLPLQVKFWPIPELSLGFGISQTMAQGDLNCSTDGNYFTCNASSIKFDQVGFKKSYLSWMVTLGTKYRLENSDLWVTGDLSLINSPNIIQDSTLNGLSSLVLRDLVAVVGLRYGIWGK